MNGEKVVYYLDNAGELAIGRPDNRRFMMQIKLNKIAKENGFDQDKFTVYMMYWQNEIRVSGTMLPSIEEKDVPRAIELYSINHEEVLKEEKINSTEIEQEQILQKRIAEMKLTTGFDFQGYLITEYLDVIFDEMVVGLGLGKAITSSLDNWFSSLTGTEATEIIEKLNDVKSKLRNRVISKAAKLGANALIGIDFESSCLGSLIMVSFTATAVKIVRIYEPLSITEENN